METIQQFLHTGLYTLLNMLNQMSPYILFGFLVAGLMQAFVSPAAMTRHLAGTGMRSVAKAALFGIPLPLCSCGVLPAGVALRRNGASRAAASSFMIATPQTGVDSITATYAMLGPAFAVIRPLAALVTALGGGWLVGRTEETDAKGQMSQPADERPVGFAARLRAALRYGFFDMVRSIGGWLVLGLIIAAVIAVIVPDGFFLQFQAYPLLTMLAVVAVAVPMYVCATGSIPIAMSLMLKGLSPGTALVMLMAGPAANFASITVISKTMGRKSAAIYLTAIVVGAIACGLVIDLLLPREWFALGGANMAHVHAHGVGHWFALACSALLVTLLIIAFIANKFSFSHHHNHQIDTEMENNSNNEAVLQCTVVGMNCQHCRATVQKGLESLSGVTAADVDLASGLATIHGNVTPQQVAEKVRLLGFDVK